MTLAYNAAMDDEARESPGELTDYSKDGVDLTLIRWMLSLTPAQRLDVLQQHARAILEIRAHTPRS